MIEILPKEKLERGLPSALDAEKSILGAICLNADLIADAATALDPADFYLSANRKIYSAMLQLTEENRPIDPITVGDVLTRNGQLSEIGGMAYLLSLADGVPRRPSINQYCSIVKEKSRLRTIIEQCSAIGGRALDGSYKALELAGEMQESALTIQAHGSDNLLPVFSTMDATMREVEARRTRTDAILGLPLGISTIDRAIGGIQPGELCLVAGRPGRGKTHLLIQAALSNAHVGTPVVIFSIEMKRHEMQKRLAGHFGKIPMWTLRDERAMTADLYARFRGAMAAVAQLPIFIEDSSGLTTRELAARAALAVKRYKAGLIVVDYAQLLTASGKDDVEREAKKSRTLTRIAKDHAPVLAAAQLSRAPNHDLNKLPNMQDLKGSSQYEQDAHVILLLHRPIGDNNRPTGEDLLIIEKHREGDPGPEPVKMTEWGDFAPRNESGGLR